MKNFIDILTNKKQNVREINHKISSKSIYDVLKPINVLNIIFGLRVFEIPRDHPRPLFSWLYSLTLYTFNYGNYYYRPSNSNQTKVVIFNDTVNNSIWFTNYLVILVLITMGLYQSQSVKICAKKLHEIDVTLRALGSSSHFNTIYKKTIFGLTLTVSFIFVFFGSVISEMILRNNGFYKSPLLYLFMIQYIYAFMVEYMLVNEFFTIVRCVKSEFKRANDLLSDASVLPITSIASELIERSSSLHVDSNKLFVSSSSLHKMHSRLQVANHKLNKSRKLLRTIRQIHLELCKLSKCFSMIYGIQISLEMVMCILSNTYYLYNFYSTYSEEIKKVYGLTYLVINTILSCFPYMIRIFFITCMCDITTKEAERTNEIIHTFYANNTDYEIQKEVEIFSLQMMQCRTTFTAYGFYNLDCKRVGSCIGVITTYLVILIQVSDSIKKES